MVYNETTTVGHILNYNNVHSLRSSLTTRLADAGAIPIAKALPGSFAMGAVHGTSDSSTARPPARPVRFPF